MKHRPQLLASAIQGFTVGCDLEWETSTITKKGWHRTVPSKSVQVMSNGISKDKNTTVESHRTDTWERQTRGQLPAEDRFYHVCLSLGCRKIEKSESDSCECHSCDRKTSDNNMWDRTKCRALSGAFGCIVQIFSLIVVSESFILCFFYALRVQNYRYRLIYD